MVWASSPWDMPNTREEVREWPKPWRLRENIVSLDSDVDDDEDDDSAGYIEADPENENNNGTDTEDESNVGSEIGNAEGSDNE